MAQNPYRKQFTLDTPMQVTVEKEVAELVKAMSENAKIPANEMVNTALRRYISAHSDYIPKNKKKK
jgi:hypothetical protein